MAAILCLRLTRVRPVSETWGLTVDKCTKRCERYQTLAKVQLTSSFQVRAALSIAMRSA